MKKTVRIEEVENGFTVNVNHMDEMGYETYKEHVAKSHNEAIKIAKDYLTPKEEKES